MMILHRLNSPGKLVMAHFKKINPNLFYLLVCVFLYTPLLILYLSESSGGFILSALIWPLIIALSLLLIPTLLGLKFHRWVQWIDTIFIGPVLYVFTVVTFFPLHSGALDGRDITFSPTVVRIYSGALVVSLIVSIFLLIFKKIKPYFQRATNIIGFFVILMSVYFAFSAIPAGNKIRDKSYYADLLSKKDNIVIIMLDMVQSSFAKECLHLNKDAKEIFDGFTFYQNVASFAPSTIMSYSGLMRGGIPKDVNDVKEIDYKNNIINDMTNNGYSVKYYSPIHYALDNKNVVSLSESIATNLFKKYLAFSILCTRRYLPLQNLTPYSLKKIGWMPKYNKKVFFNWMINNAEISATSSKNFLWFHTVLTHSPVRFDRTGKFSIDLTPDDTIDEIYFAFSLVGDFINRLKELGVYENALVIILSDHGYNTLNLMNNYPPGKEWYLTELNDAESSQEPMVNYRVGQYSPLLMIKPPNSSGRLKFSNTAASLLDLRKTLNDYVRPGSAENFFGINLLDKNNNKVNREVPIFRFKGKEFKTEDFYKTEKYVIDRLKLPVDKNYKTIKYSYENIDNIAKNNGVQKNVAYAIALNDLTRIANALNKYHEKHGVYPKSQGFDGLYTKYGRSGSDWIKGLAPLYIEALPRDPRMKADPDRQYFYNSNGNDYKLIAHNGPEFTEVKKFYPKMIDPMRPTTSYGTWTKGAESW